MAHWHAVTQALAVPRQALHLLLRRPWVMRWCSRMIVSESCKWLTDSVLRDQGHTL